MEITTHKLRSQSTPVFRGPFLAGNLPERRSDVPPVPPLEGDGGGVAGGVATVSQPTLHIGSGGAVAGGVASVGSSSIVTATGGGVGHGVADVTYTPPPPTPGTDCASAAALSAGQHYAYHMPASTTWWFKVNSVTSGGNFNLSSFGIGASPNWTVNAYSGSCPVPSVITFAHTSTNCRDWVNPTAGPIFIVIQTALGISGDITINPNSGLC